MNKLKMATSRVLQSDIEYFFEQFMYGGRELLLHHIRKEYKNFPANSFLKAGLSHGWGPDEQLWKLRNRNLTRAPRYVWNERFARFGSNSNRSRATGAPWIYLLESLGIKPGMKVSNRKINPDRPNLLMLTHNVESTNKRIDLQAEFFDALCDGSRSVVCLYWLDFCNTKIRESYERLGFKVVCAGYPHKFNIQYQKHPGRADFLPNVLEIMSRHQTYFTDECTTSLFYAASLGMKVELHVDDVALEFQNNWKNFYNGDGVEFFNSGNDWLIKYFPSLLNNSHSDKSLNEFAWLELGLNSKLTASELKDLKWCLNKNILGTQLSTLESRLDEIESELVLSVL